MAGSAIGAAVSIGGAIIKGNAASDAADAQAQASANSLALEKSVHDENVALEQPYVAAGTAALPTLTSGVAPGGQFNRPFTMADAQNMPAYQFAKKEGEGAIENSAAARGMSLSTDNIRDLIKFNAANAAQYENQAFNQYETHNVNALNAVTAATNLGQNAVAQTAASGTNYANAGTNINDAAGKAAAAGIVGSTAPLVNTVGNIFNNADTQYKLNSLLNGGT